MLITPGGRPAALYNCVSQYPLNIAWSDGCISCTWAIFQVNGEHIKLLASVGWLNSSWEMDGERRSLERGETGEGEGEGEGEEWRETRAREGAFWEMRVYREREFFRETHKKIWTLHKSKRVEKKGSSRERHTYERAYVQDLAREKRSYLPNHCVTHHSRCARQVSCYWLLVAFFAHTGDITLGQQQRRPPEQHDSKRNLYLSTCNSCKVEGRDSINKPFQRTVVETIPHSLSADGLLAFSLV